MNKNLKPSEIFEGEDSSLNKTFDEASKEITKGIEHTRAFPFNENTTTETMVKNYRNNNQIGNTNSAVNSEPVFYDIQNNNQNKWEEEFDKAFPRKIMEVYKQGDGSMSAGVVIMNNLIKQFISKTIQADREEIYCIVKNAEVTLFTSDKSRNEVLSSIAKPSNRCIKCDMLENSQTGSEKQINCSHTFIINLIN